MADFVAAIDQGTTSTRCMIFDHSGREVGKYQLEHKQIMPEAGWVEHDPLEIWQRTQEVVQQALAGRGLVAADLAGLGITNQRETTVVWNPVTGEPYGNAIVWQDTRTDKIAAALDRDGRGDVIRHRAGLPPATYFSGGKLQWILENVEGVRQAAERGRALFGTTDSWLLWNLTGGVEGGQHVTDVTNASRTMLMDLETLDWDAELLSFFGIPQEMLPSIVASSDAAAYQQTRADGPFGGEVTIAGDLGDQQAAMVGQVCLRAGDAKNTYGTGNFLLLNTARATAFSAPCVTGSATPRRSTPSRAPSRSPVRLCSGFATSSRSFATHKRSRRWRARSTAQRTCTSFLPSLASSHLIGAPMPVESSWACPASIPGLTSRGRLWKPSAIRVATWSRRWKRMPVSNSMN
jgi:glycerol kinase